jgi:hypothetical protein
MNPVIPMVLSIVLCLSLNVEGSRAIDRTAEVSGLGAGLRAPEEIATNLALKYNGTRPDEGLNKKSRTPSFCDSYLTDLALPTGVWGLAASYCTEFGGYAHTERFVGDGMSLTGVGFWFVMTNGLPSVPEFDIYIYLTGQDGCPESPINDPIFYAVCDLVEIGPGSGSPDDPIEYFCDFTDNGYPDFLKEAGVEYSIMIVNNNCPGEGLGAYWAEGVGDGIFGCVPSEDYWIPKTEEIAWDNAMYLCNAEPIVPTVCDDPDTTNLVPPDGIVGLAATECREGWAHLEHTERFSGNGQLVSGVGFWFNMLGGLPALPIFIIRIYETGGDGCPLEPPLLAATCNIVQIGQGTGTVEDPIEYYCNFSDNGYNDFPAEVGVEYSISIVSANCPGEGESAYWASGAGDGLYGCIISPFGFPDWTPKSGAGFAWDNAMYLCSTLTTSVPEHSLHTGTGTLLLSNYPNPFDRGTTIRYQLDRAGSVRLRIFNIQGAIVRKLDNVPTAVGIHSLRWDGLDDGGRPVTAGVYALEFQAGEVNQVRKLMVLR